MGNTDGTALALLHLGIVALCRCDFALGEARLAESLALSRERDDKGNTAFALFYLGDAAACRGHYKAAAPFFEESLRNYLKTC